MAQKKTLQQREKELQSLMATAEGCEELRQLAARYSSADDTVKPERGSIITYILVYERHHGLIST